VNGELEDAYTTETFIAGTRTLENGKTVFRMNTRNRFTGEPSPAYVFTANAGASNYTHGAEENGVSVLHEVLHVKWPARTGERYLTRFVGVDTITAQAILDTLEIEVVNAAGTCATGAGSFACVHYRGRRLDGSVFADTWYAPGVGYLGSEILRTSIANDTTREWRHVKKLSAYILH
jgi:hypothetical protein